MDKAKKKKKKKEETSWDTNVAMCDNDENNSSQECQVEASHYKMGVVMQEMIQGSSAKQSKPHSQCVTRIHGERSYDALTQL